MWPDRVSNPGPLTYESGALPNALRGPAVCMYVRMYVCMPGCVEQSVARLTQEPEVPGSIPGPAKYFRFSFL